MSGRPKMKGAGMAKVAALIAASEARTASRMARASTRRATAAAVVGLRKNRSNLTVRKAKKIGGSRAAVGNLDLTVSDGLNRSRVMVNNSTIEDKFQIRREKIANIAGNTGAFAVAQSLYLNPGNSTLFPIFSQIATTYEQFRVNHLKLIYETEAYTASGSTASAGLALLGTNFDPDDPTFTSDTQMENYEGTVRGPPYTRLVHDVLRAHKARNRGKDLALNAYFVNGSQNQAAPSNSTSKFYDVGLFQLAMENNAATTALGELFVEYSFTMIRPKQPDVPLFSLLQAYAGKTSTATSAQNFAGMSTAGGLSSLACVVTGNTITFPATSSSGTFLIVLSVFENTSQQLLTTNFAATSGCTFSTATIAGTSTMYNQYCTGVASNNCLGLCLVTLTAPSAVVTWSPMTLSNSGSGTVAVNVFPVAPSWASTSVVEALLPTGLLERLKILESYHSRAVKAPVCVEVCEDEDTPSSAAVFVSAGCGIGSCSRPVVANMGGTRMCRVHSALYVEHLPID